MELKNLDEMVQELVAALGGILEVVVKDSPRELDGSGQRLPALLYLHLKF